MEKNLFKKEILKKLYFRLIQKRILYHENNFVNFGVKKGFILAFLLLVKTSWSEDL